jgi:multiple sugar transport system permease protein
VFTVVTVTVELFFGVTIAYALRKPFRGRPLIRLILLIPWLVSPVANGVMWHYLFNTENGMINFLPALLGLPRPPSPLNSGLALFAAMTIEIWRKTPLVSFLVLPGILAIPAVQWDQAELDGYSTLTRMRHIVLSRLRLLLLAVGLLLIGDALGTSESIVILTGGGPGSETMLPGLYSYRQAFQTFDWTGGSTSAWLIMLAVLVVGVCYVFLTKREAKA